MSRGQNQASDGTHIMDGISKSPGHPAIMIRPPAMRGAAACPLVRMALPIVRDTLAKAAGARQGERVLEVAAVTGALPFAAASFDVVLSCFGVMFSPEPALAAREMLRVARPGGRIAMASWTQEGFVGRLYQALAAHVAPWPGAPLPALWGAEPHLVALFGPRASGLRVTRRIVRLRFRSAAQCLQVLRGQDGLVRDAFAALDEARAADLANALLALLCEFDTGAAAGLVVPGEYAEAIVEVAGRRTVHSERMAPMCGSELTSLPEGVQRVARALQDKGHPHAPVMLDDAARTAQQAADALGIQLGQIAKSIIFRRKADDAAVLVITSGDRRVDEKKVDAIVGKTGRADAEFVKARTGFTIGGVSPVAHAQPPVTLIDRELFRFAEIWAAAGHPHGVFKLKPQDLERLTGAPVADVVQVQP
jgi:prolyl-tRNA editing enzyme YbaK/EbsC (Cys-tRNA(Pro) deacylase)/SAM-dependent methyltransferase